jgi:DNA-3-methyladenine glycosylase II
MQSLDKINSHYTPPPFWEKARTHLTENDRVMQRLISHHDGVFLYSRGDPFKTLARSIVGQKISVKSADSVWNKFSQLCHEESINPQRVLQLTPEEMRKTGLSMQKVNYLDSLAIYFIEKNIQQDHWDGLSDETVIHDLMKIRGIGRWTAEMFLIFYLLRPNILPLDDVGLLRGISKNYFSGEPVSRSEAREVANSWKPYRSVATWYIWCSIDPVAVGY